MTIKPSDCPLDLIRQAPDPGTKLAHHTHDPCLCLDLHHWRAVPGPLGAQECADCGAHRCSAIRGVQRCVRRASHRGGKHLFTR